MTKIKIIEIIYDPECDRYVAIGKNDAKGLIAENDTLEGVLEDCHDLVRTMQEMED